MKRDSLSYSLNGKRTPQTIPDKPFPATDESLS
jgi:hypothetical protein